MAKIIGIDLGTTNSCISIMDKEVKIISNEEGSRTTPSVVAKDNNGEYLVGQIAKRQAVVNPENTISSVKRLIGLSYEEAKNEEKNISYKIINDGGTAKIQLTDGTKLTPQEVSAKVLQKMKRAAEDYLGETVTEAVITVPAYFNDAARQATKDAGKIAGLQVKRIINEPTAAALAYGLDKNNQTIVVYDFGGGTFDISILEIADGVIQVISTNGDTHLGGDDIDNLLVNWLATKFKEDQGVDLSKDKMVLQRLKEAAEKAKIELSSISETEINLPFITADATGPKHLLYKLTRAAFEKLIMDIVDKTISPCKKAMADANKSVNDISEVVLVGGSTRIPLVQQRIKEFFGKEPNKSVNPDEAVAAGAAIQAGVLTGEVTDILLLDVTPLSLGIETLGGVMTTMIPRNTTIPTKKTEVFSTAANDQPAVDVHVLQGERKFARDNKTLGVFKLDGIPLAPRGVPKIEVTFDIDANGIVNVSAVDLGTNKKQHITITSSSGLKDNEIDKMVKEAAEHEEEDKKRKEEIDIKNNLDSQIYNIEKFMNENKDKLSSENIEKLNKVLEEGKTSLASNDIDKIKEAANNLMETMYKISEEMYKNQTNPQNATDVEFQEK